MISRVAEHCFWLSRYLERAENTARVLEVNQTLLLDFEVPYEQQWKPVLIISGIHDYPGPFDAETIQEHMTWNEENPCSIVSSMGYARENARIIREVISADMWERVNHYHLWMREEARVLYASDRWGFYNQIKRINQMVYGICEATMAHDEAWDFYQLGKYLERASQTARILDVKYHIVLPTPEHIGTPVDNAHWVAILKSCSGYEMFHKHRGSLGAGNAVADYLIFDRVFPRSIRFCLRSCLEAAYKISGNSRDHEPCNEVEAQLHSLINWLTMVNIDDMIRKGLHESLTTVVNRIQDLGAAISKTFFDFDEEHVHVMQQLQTQ